MANKQTSDLTAATSLNFTDIFALVQSPNSRRGSLGQVRDLIDQQTSRTLVKPPGNQGRLSIVAGQALVTPNGADGTIITASALIPARSIVLSVTAYVVNALTGGMTTFDVGLGGGSETLFGAAIGAAAGSSNVGVVSPFPTYAATDVTVRINGGTGTGNTDKIRLVAYYLSFTTPTA